jgi:hypothetical protein
MATHSSAPARPGPPLPRARPSCARHCATPDRMPGLLSHRCPGLAARARHRNIPVLQSSQQPDSPDMNSRGPRGEAARPTQTAVTMATSATTDTVLGDRCFAGLVRSVPVVVLVLVLVIPLGFRFHNGVPRALGALGLVPVSGFAFMWLYALIGMLVKTRRRSSSPRSCRSPVHLRQLGVRLRCRTCPAGCEPSPAASR